MSITIDMQIYKKTRDINQSIIQTQKPSFNRKPRTLHLELFAMHAKKITYHRNDHREWKTTFAYAIAEVIKEYQYHLTQPSPYRTRITVMDGNLWFIDMYFASTIANSEAWKMRMQMMIHETLRNHGAVCNDLYMKYYPIRQSQHPMPNIDWKALEKKPYLDDD